MESSISCAGSTCVKYKNTNLPLNLNPLSEPKSILPFQLFHRLVHRKQLQPFIASYLRGSIIYITIATQTLIANPIHCYSSPPSDSIKFRNSQKIQHVSREIFDLAGVLQAELGRRTGSSDSSSSTTYKVMVLFVELKLR